MRKRRLAFFFRTNPWGHQSSGGASSEPLCPRSSPLDEQCHTFACVPVSYLLTVSHLSWRRRFAAGAHDRRGSIWEGLECIAGRRTFFFVCMYLVIFQSESSLRDLGVNLAYIYSAHCGSFTDDKIRSNAESVSITQGIDQGQYHLGHKVLIDHI